MKLKSLETALVAMIVIGLAILGWLAWRYPDAPAQPPRTPVIAPPAPVGCTGSISVRIEEDGTVTTWCPEGGQ